MTDALEHRQGRERPDPVDILALTPALGTEPSEVDAGRIGALALREEGPEARPSVGQALVVAHEVAARYRSLLHVERRVGQPDLITVIIGIGTAADGSRVAVYRPVVGKQRVRIVRVVAEVVVGDGHGPVIRHVHRGGERLLVTCRDVRWGLVDLDRL